MFVGLEVILGYFPACREAQALLVALQPALCTLACHFASAGALSTCML